MRVEREVVCGERDVCVEERLQPALHPKIDHPWIGVPEEPVVDDEQLGIDRRSVLEQLAGCRNPARDLGHLVGADHLEPDRSVVRVRVDVEQLVGKGNDRVARCHEGGV